MQFIVTQNSKFIALCCLLSRILICSHVTSSSENGISEISSTLVFRKSNDQFLLTCPKRVHWSSIQGSQSEGASQRNVDNSLRHDVPGRTHCSFALHDEDRTDLILKVGPSPHSRQGLNTSQQVRPKICERDPPVFKAQILVCFQIFYCCSRAQKTLDPVVGGYMCRFLSMKCIDTRENQMTSSRLHLTGLNEMTMYACISGEPSAIASLCIPSERENWETPSVEAANEFQHISQCKYFRI